MEGDGEGGHVEPEDMVSLKALSDEDLAYIAKNPGYQAMLQDILTSIIRENSSKGRSADNTGPNNSEGRGTDTTRPHPTKRTGVPDQHSGSSESSDDE